MWKSSFTIPENKLTKVLGDINKKTSIIIKLSKKILEGFYFLKKGINIH